VPTGVAHGTVTVLADDGSYEVTTFRGEGAYSDGRHPDEVTFLPEVEGDLARRDFTMNAMALDPESGTLVDPNGGLEAIGARRLEAVGDPVERFREDGLRPLRAARFVAVLEMDPAPGIVEAMEATREVFRGVSAERKRIEIVKMMAARQPSRGLRMLERAGYVPLIFPGLERTIGCEQGGRHEHDVWTHSLLAADAMDPTGRDPLLRLAALLHDAGKPDTAVPRQGEREGMHFYGHEQVGELLVRGWLRDLRFPNADVELVARLVRHHMVIYGPEWTDAAVRRFMARVGPDQVDHVIDLAIADVRTQGRSGFLVPLAEELRSRVHGQIASGAALSRSDLALDGDDLMEGLGIGPGPRLGEILEALLERVVDDPSLNERDVLLDLADRLCRDPGKRE
jgi:tRNA nucleotidyltransferase (CCA-adding enzyme)